MEIKDFIGKTVIFTGMRCKITEITSPLVRIVTEQTNSGGYPSHYVFPTINGDPISSGTLVFEDASLTEPFKAAYAAHCRTQSAYYEEIGYWMRKD